MKAHKNKIGTRHFIAHLFFSFLDPVNGEQLRLMCTDTVCTGRVLHSGVQTLQKAIARERSHRWEYVDGLTHYTRELEQLDGAKEELLDGLEQMQAGVDDTVNALRADVERAHDEYEECRRRFFRTSSDSAAVEGFGALQEPMTVRNVDADRFHQSLCGGDTVTSAVSLSSHTGYWPENIDDDDDGDGDEDDAATALTIFRRLRRDAVARGGDARRSRTYELQTLWRAVRSVSEYNRSLETAARALEEQTETLQTGLRDAVAACTALDADQSVNKCRSVVLDDFCAVAEQITAQQIRNLEFGRMLAVDERQIDEELQKIGQLKAKISK